MPEVTAIEMIDNSWDSQKQRLGRGNTYQVPGEISADDAAILIVAEAARAADQSEKPVAKMSVKELRKELDRRKVDYLSSARKDELATLLADARNKAEGKA